MECNEAREKLLEYREGQLDLEGRMHLEAHLLVCEGCLRELQALEALMATIVALPVPDPSPGFIRRLQARIEEEKRGRLPVGAGFTPPVSGGCQALPYIWPRLRPAWATALLAFVLVAGGALWAFLPLARCLMSDGGCWTLPDIDHRTSSIEHPVWDLGSEEEAELILNLWPSRGPDWIAFGEGGDRLLASLALGGDRPHSVHPEAVSEGWMEESNIKEVVGIWTIALPGRKAMEVLAGMIELSDQELEALLMRLGKGSAAQPSSAGGEVEAGLLRV